jgi:hypothetical protein
MQVSSVRLAACKSGQPAPADGAVDYNVPSNSRTAEQVKIVSGTSQSTHSGPTSLPKGQDPHLRIDENIDTGQGQPMPLFSKAKNVVREVIATRGLKTKCFDDWEPELDEVLQCLPATDVFPHELFRSLMKMASCPGKKQLILVLDRGEPVALVGLKNRWGGWEPVTQWIVPGVIFPVKREEYIGKVLAALGLRIRIAWWRWDAPPPPVSWIKSLVSTPTYGTRCAGNFEEYWRETDFFKNVRNYRNRCRGFHLSVNLPGSREWTITKWSAKWHPQGAAEMPDLADRLLASEYLEKRGLYHTLSLVDADELVAGLSFLIHRNTAVAQVNYRVPSYDRHGVMTRLMDLSFYWAREKGFETIDLGGSFDYKEKWAPKNGEKWEFDVSSRYIRLREGASRLWSRARKMF